MLFGEFYLVVQVVDAINAEDIFAPVVHVLGEQGRLLG